MASSASAAGKSKTVFAKRQLTLMKKAYELSTLCGIDVCVICYSSDGTLETWPKNTAKVRDMAEKYKRLSEAEKRKRRLDLSGFLEKMKLDDEKKSRDLESKFLPWDKRLDGFSTQELSELEEVLENKLERLKERVKSLNTRKQEKVEEEDANLGKNSRSTFDVYPPVLSNFETVISPFPNDQQQQQQQLASANFFGETQFSTLPNNYYPQCLTLAPIPNVAFDNRYYGQNNDCSSNNNVLGFNQNFLVSGIGDSKFDCDFLGTANNDYSIGNYSGVMRPHGYYENVNSNNNLVIMNNFNAPQLQFPQLSTSTPYQELGPFLAWSHQQQPFQG